MRILMIGDIVGAAGREYLINRLPEFKKREGIDFVCANGENSAKPNGIDRESAADIFSAGVDVITTGNHVWHRREMAEYITECENILRPVNFPDGAPGSGTILYDCGRYRIGVINLMGRAFMDSVDCPFTAADREIERLKRQTNIIIVDFHAETTSEKKAMGYYLDGRVSLVAGTHTHVQTSDAAVLAGGTGYITDLGMTGVTDSILGIKKDIIIYRFLTRMPKANEQAEGECTMCGVIADINARSGAAESISAVVV